ncbi:MAG TPA: hypothetical protein VGM56_31655 [Byssovorax sp.]|jgi:hypothetical protein
MPTYYGVEGPSASNGYLIANGNVYTAESGTSKLQDIPAGDYTYGDAIPLDKRSERTSMTDGSDWHKFRKFHIWGTGPQGAITDPRKGRHKLQRTGIEFHYDGGNVGTAGCIGYQDPAAQQDLINDPDKSVQVQYFQTDAEVRAAIEAKLGHTVDWSKVRTRGRAGGAGANAGLQSTTRKGKKVTKGNTTVKAGPHARDTAHIQASLEGGGQVVQGSQTVFVGPEMLPVSGVDHLTSDGSPLAVGESSILFT